MLGRLEGGGGRGRGESIKGESGVSTEVRE